MRKPALSCLLLGACTLGLSVAVSAQQAVTTEPVSVYAGPDDSYPPVAQLDSGAPVRVMGCLDDWSWCDVKFEDMRGWLYAPDLTYDYQDSYVPLYTYAPGLGIPVVQFTIGDYWDRYYHGRPWYAQRDEWERRGPPHHRRPPGPPPSAGPPPRSARVDRPPQNNNQERSLRLGRAGPSPSDSERRDGARAPDGDRRPDGERRAGDATPPEPHPAAPGVLSHPGAPARESHPSPEVRPATPPHEEHPPAPGRDQPTRHEEHPSTPQRAEATHHEEEATNHEKPHHPAKPADHPSDSPPH
jgi:uncharacterized protein YraI